MTPLVDVMLVLLIIFMITAPMMNTGVSLELPQVTAQNVEDPEGKLVLSIAKDNKIFLGGTQVTWKDLEAKLKANERVQKESALYIEADTHLRVRRRDHGDGARQERRRRARDDAYQSVDTRRISASSTRALATWTSK